MFEGCLEEAVDEGKETGVRCCRGEGGTVFRSGAICVWRMLKAHWLGSHVRQGVLRSSKRPCTRMTECLQQT